MLSNSVMTNSLGASKFICDKGVRKKGSIYVVKWSFKTEILVPYNWVFVMTMFVITEFQ